MIQLFCGKDRNCTHLFRQHTHIQWKLYVNCLHYFNSVLWAAKGETKLYLKSKSVLWCEGFYYPKIRRKCEMNAVGNIRAFFKSQLEFLEGHKRLCREMKADSFRYTDMHKIKKGNSWSSIVNQRNIWSKKSQRFCSSCQEAAAAYVSFAVAFLFKFDSYHRQGVTTFAHQKLSRCL